MPRATTKFERHVRQLFACRTCPTVVGTPISGPVEGASVLLVGQAPGPHEEDEGRPFAWTAGKKLFSWFSTIGVGESEFRNAVFMAAVIRCFPGKDPSGGDRVPYPAEIAACGEHLDTELRLLKPELMIAVGTLASLQIVGKAQLKDVVGRMHQASRAGTTFDVIVLPHPSGRSTWLNKSENAELLRRSLQLIASHPAWRKTFGSSRAV